MGQVALPESTGNIGTFASLRLGDFRLFLAGSILSNAAQWIQQITLSWLIFDLTGSGTMLGTINLVRTAASLVMIPFAGLLVDRLNRRMLITIENGWLFAITLPVGLAILSGYTQLWYLFIFAFLGGMVQTVDQTLRQVIVFDLVPRRLVPNAVALIQTGWSLMRVLGPSIGGLMILAFGAGGNFLVQASAYVLIAVTIVQIRFPARKPERVHNSPLQNVREGLKYVATERLTRTFTLMGILLPLLTIPIFSILPPIYAVDVYHDDSGRILGLLMASVGAGGIIGGVVSASLGRVEYRGRLQLLALLLLNVALMAFALSSNLPLALVFMAVAGFFEMIFLTTNQTLLQLSIPDHMRGRVTAVQSLSTAVSPVGAMLAGVGSDLLGGPKMITIVLASVSAIIAVLVFVASPTVRNYRLSEGMAPLSAKRPGDQAA